MAKILEMPKLSPTMEEGVLSAWHKKEGDAVEVDDLLADVETDKATMEYRAFDRGTLLKLLVPGGALVKLGQPVAILGAPGEDVSKLTPATPAASAAAAPAPHAAPPPPPPPLPPASPPAAAPAPSTTPTMAPAPAAPPAPRASATPRLDRTEHEPEAAPPAEGRVLASPYVRKLARDLGKDLRGVQGSGPGGRVSAADVTAADTKAPSRALATRDPAAPPALARAAVAGLEPPEVRPLSMMRRTIARRLTESKSTVPHFYLRIDVDADAVVGLRAQINAELAKTAPGRADEAPDKVSVNDLLVKACAAALVRVPECNAQFAGDAIHVFRRVDISVAVAVPDGLVTPVVRDADRKSVVAIAREVRDLAARARSKKLSLDEMTNGTFSISNLGMFGVDDFAAVINPPEGAILAVGRLREEPAVKDGQLVVGERMRLTLSCDHRVIDGAVGAAFLAELRALLEHPMRLLTG